MVFLDYLYRKIPIFIVGFCMAYTPIDGQLWAQLAVMILALIAAFLDCKRSSPQ